MRPGGFQNKSTQMLLQWYEPGASASEEMVELLEREGRFAVILSPVELHEYTEIVLLHAGVSESGVVLACNGTENSFVINVQLTSPEQLGAHERFERDPGALVVDSFLTVEQEEAILQDLAKELGETADTPEQNGCSDDSSTAKSLLRLLLATWRSRAVAVVPEELFIFPTL